MSTTSDYNRAYYERNKELIKAKARKEDPVKRAARVKQWKTDNPERVAAQRRKQRYGLSPEAYDDLLAKQGGHCATCPSTKKLSVDHCHDTSRVRGILCHNCNVTLGFALDDPARLLALAEYASSSPGSG